MRTAKAFRMPSSDSAPTWRRSKSTPNSARCRVLKITAAHDVGRAINPTLIEGQIEGGAAQGLGHALMEEFFPGKGENLHDYLIPSAGDMPPVESILIEDPSPIGPFGAKGIGEQAVIPTAPAILNAIHDAIGVRIHRIPATPDRIRAAILAQRDEGQLPCLTTTPSAAMPAPCSATSSPGGWAPATATAIATANWFASIRTWCSTALSNAARRSFPSSAANTTGTATSLDGRKPSLPPSVPAQPIPTTSPPRSSSRLKSKASTWSRSSRRASSATAA